MTQRLKDVRCDKCGRVLCQRRGDTVIEGNLELLLKRKHYIRCRCCDGYTVFSIDTNSKRDKNSVVS